MYFSKSAALVLALATGFASQAVAYPWYPGGNIEARHPHNAPALPAPEVFPPLKRADKKGKKDDEIIITEIKIEEIEEIKDGNKVTIIEEVETVLIEDKTNNKKKNKERKDAYKKKDSNKTTVLIIVKEIVIVIVDKGKKIEKIIFAESEIIVNKGQKQTNTVMISDTSKLTAGGATGTEGAVGATDVGTGAVLTGTGIGNAVNATQAVTLAAVAPTWTSIDQDPINILPTLIS